eukprot:UN25202
MVRKIAKMKDTNAPKKPASAWMLFCEAKRKEVAAANPTLKMTQVSTILSNLWRDEPPESKQQYVLNAEKLKRIYDEKFAQYKDTQQYLEYQKRNQIVTKLRKHAQELGIKVKKDTVRFPSDPNAPKRYPSAYFLWAAKVREQVLANNPGTSMTTIGKMLGKQWAQQTDEVKQIYNKQAQKLKEEYEAKLDEYQEGESYKRYRAVRAKFEQEKRKIEIHYKASVRSMEERQYQMKRYQQQRAQYEAQQLAHQQRLAEQGILPPYNQEHYQQYYQQYYQQQQQAQLQGGAPAQPGQQQGPQPAQVPGQPTDQTEQIPQGSAEYQRQYAEYQQQYQQQYAQYQQQYAQYQQQLQMQQHQGQGHPQAVQGHPQQGVGHPQQVVQGHPQQAVQGHPQQAVQGHPQQAVQGHPQAVQGHPQQPGTAGQPQSAYYNPALQQSAYASYYQNQHQQQQYQ